MIPKSVFVTGGAGYVGSCLVPELLKEGYKVTVYDIMYFGDNFLPKKNPSLNIIEGDIRDIKKLKNSCRNHEFFLHLACISNDASFELDEKLSKSINFDAFEPMVLAVKKSGYLCIHQFSLWRFKQTQCNRRTSFGSTYPL